MAPPTSPTSRTRRAALPLSFLRPSHPSSPSKPSPQHQQQSKGGQGQSEERDLAVAADGSFVETTSEVAARALAKFYEEQGQGEGEFGVIKVQREGKTVYRIRCVLFFSRFTRSG